MSSLALRRLSSPARPAALLLAFALGAVSVSCAHPAAMPVRSATSVSKPATPGPTSIPDRLALSEQQERAGEMFAAIEQVEVTRGLGGADEAPALRLARLYGAVGEFEQAARVLTEATARPGASPEAHLALSKARFKLGDFLGAAQAVHPLVPSWRGLPEADRQYVARTLLLAGDAPSANPLLPESSADPEWLALRGLSALTGGQPSEAVKTLARAVALNPRDSWNVYLLGWARQEAGDRKGALAAWQAAAALPDAPSRALTGAATILAQTGRTGEAERLLRQIRHEDEEMPAYWQAWNAIARARKQPVQEAVTRGYAAFYGGDPWQAEAIWRSILPAAKGDDAREIYAAIHNSAFRRHDMDVADRFAEEASSRWPDDAYFLKRRAEVLLGQNRLAQALAAGQRLQQIAAPAQQAEAAELVARIALDSGKPDLLTQNADRCRSLRPHDPDPVLHLAEWQAQAGRSQENLERTLALYREAAAIDPQNAEAPARAGLVLIDLKRTEEAVPTLLHALSLSPRVLDGTPNVQLAQIDRQQGRLPESQFEETQYQRLHRLKDDWPSLLKLLRSDGPLPAWKALGQAALDRRETWIALCAYVRCTQKAPHDAAGWFSLAAAEKRMGWFEEALAAVQRGRAIGPHPLFPSPKNRGGETGKTTFPRSPSPLVGEGGRG